MTDDSPLVQVLSTEHWSLLATRSMTWSEIFSRTTTLLTVLSANAIALSLVASVDGFDDAFYTFALTALPLVLFVGVGTFVRLVEADIEDAWLVIGMNRIRAAYVELVPEVVPYLVAGHTDDPRGLMQTYSFRSRVGLSHWMSGSPVVVGLVDAGLAGVIAGIAASALGAPVGLSVGVAVVTGVLAAVGLGVVGLRKVRAVQQGYVPRFPSAPGAE